MTGSRAWFYGGIRSYGRFVCVLDELRQPRVCYLVIGSRRKLRMALREEFSDAFIIVPITKTEGIEFEIRHKLGQPVKRSVRT